MRKLIVKLLLLFTMFMGQNIWAQKPKFQIYLTWESFNVKEKFGTFKLKRKIKKVCYPYKINKSADGFTYLFPTCQLNLKLKKIKDGYAFFPEDKFLNHSKNTELFINFIFSAHNPKELFYGLGTQYTHFKLNGHKIPILSQEQGNGRGLQPLSRLQRIFTNGIQGHSFTTYMSNSFVASSLGRALYIDSPNYMQADFTKTGSFRLSHHKLTGRLLMAQKQNIRELLPISARWLGTQPKLPNWVHKGAIIGLQGGQKNTEKRMKKILSTKANVSALWLQDWVGLRNTFLGPRLDWNWQLDSTHYPQWNNLVESLEENNIKTMGYFNPYLSEGPKENPMLKQALRNRHLVIKENGELLKVAMGGFSAYLINLFNKDTYEWTKSWFVKEAKEAKLAGWMADFAEAYPLHSHNSGDHHTYIQLWQKLNKEVRQELDQQRAYKSISFHRAGANGNNQDIPLYWLGDQTPTYDDLDGLKSTVKGLLSSSLSSVAYNHSDIGGYFAIKIPFIINMKRTRSLLKRWMEVNAFTMVFRTHQGLKPSLIHQIDNDSETLELFSKWSNIFSSLYDYRLSLIKEYESNSIAPVRPLFIEFPQDQTSYNIDDQFMFGPDYLVAPVYKDHALTKKTYLPPGSWRHIWNDHVFDSTGQFFSVKLHENTTPVFKKL